jgi:hypothetical protein
MHETCELRQLLTSTVTIAATTPDAYEQGTVPAVATLSRTDTSMQCIVYWSTSGTAMSGMDYGAGNGSVTMAAGVSTATVSFTPYDDMWQESDETIIVAISTGAYNIGSPSTATLTIHDNDHSPTDISLSNSSVAENQSSGATVGNLSTTDGDAGDTFTYSLVSGTGSTDNSSFSISGNQLVTAASFDYETKNSYSVRVRSTDAASHTYEKAFTISVTNVNEAPVITSNGGGSTASVSIAENTTAVTTVTATDVDAGSSLTYCKSGAADSSQFSINSATGALTFVTAPDYEVPTDANGDNVYVVDVQASDGSLTDTQTISVTVTDVFDPLISIAATDGSASEELNEDEETDPGVFTISRTGSTASSITVYYTIVTGAGNATNGTDYDSISGSAIITSANASTEVTIQPIDDALAEGIETVELHITDGNEYDLDSLASAYLTLNDNDTAPVAVDDLYSNSSSSLSVSVPGVLGNDDDMDGDTPTAVLYSNPSHGSVTLNANGSFVYTPSGSPSVTDSFSYRAFDGANYSDPALVSINNPPPVGVADEYVVDDTSLTVSSPGVLENDTDGNGDTLTAILDTQPQHGTISLGSNGSFVYTPVVDFEGYDFFSYHPSDGVTPGIGATVTFFVGAGRSPFSIAI